LLIAPGTFQVQQQFNTLGKTTMTHFFKLLASSALLITVSAPSHAGIIFTFTESGANVVMNSSGVIDTTNLVPQLSVSGWGGAGIEENGNHDIMGGTTVGGVDVSFGFNAGTDFSPWASANGPWAANFFSTIVDSGVKGFTTYRFDGGSQLPGLGVESADIVDGFWSPDQNWTFANQTFASLGMFTGTYTVTDAVTAEFITFQVGPAQAQVPEPSTLLLAGLGLAGLGFARRKQRNALV